jgi:hypothetical protein
MSIDTVAEDRNTTMPTTILNILNENWDNPEKIGTLTARQLRQILEPRLGVDLSDKEKLIEEVLKSFREAGGEKEEVLNSFQGAGGEKEGVLNSFQGAGGEKEGESESVMKQNSKGKPSAASKTKRRRKRRVSLSDDEDDEDYNPRKLHR